MGQILFQLITQGVDDDLLVRGEVSAQVILTVELADNDSDLLDVRLYRDG